MVLEWSPLDAIPVAVFGITLILLADGQQQQPFFFVYHP